MMWLVTGLKKLYSYCLRTNFLQNNNHNISISRGLDAWTLIQTGELSDTNILFSKHYSLSDHDDKTGTSISLFQAIFIYHILNGPTSLFQDNEHTRMIFHSLMMKTVTIQHVMILSLSTEIWTHENHFSFSAMQEYSNSSLPDHGWPLIDLVLWSSTFGILAIAIIIGNLLTIVVFTRKKVLRSRANYFLVSLAIADFLVGLVTIPMYMYTLVSYWKYGTKLQADFFYSYMAIDMFTGFASIFALTIIAIERLYAILWPFKHRIATKQMYHFLVSIAWILSGLISIFYYLWSYQVLKFKFFFYMIMFFIFTSLTIIWIAYGLIWIKLKVRICKRRESSSDSSVETLHVSSIRNHGNLRRQDHDVILPTLCIVTVMFLITWVPFYILNIVVFFRGGQKGIPEEAFYFSKLLHYGNSLVNPIVYSIKIPKFSRSVSVFFRRKRRAIVKSLRSKYTSSKSSSSHRKTRSAFTESTVIWWVL